MATLIQDRREFDQSIETTNKTLKVLQVTEASCAGVGGHVLDLAEGLPDHGVEVHLIYSTLRIDEPFRHRIESNARLNSTAMDFKRAPQIKDWSFTRKIKRYLRDHGPFDIVHAHSTKAGGLTRMPFNGLGVKNVYTPNGIFTMNPTLGRAAFAIARRIELMLAKRSDLIIAVSPEEQAHMLALGMPEEKVQFVANGIRQHDWQERAQLRRELGLDQNALIVGFLGRLANQKNPLLMIEAFGRVIRKQQAGKNVRLAMVGEGPLESECRALADQLGIGSHVDWLGFKTAQESMPAFDLFVMPSQYEGMPYVMMEAMSIGLPIVATEVGGTSIGIAPGVNGFVTRKGDVEALSQKVWQLVMDDQLRAEFAEASKKRAEQFSVEKMVARTLQLYQSLSH